MKQIIRWGRWLILGVYLTSPLYAASGSWYELNPNALKMQGAPPPTTEPKTMKKDPDKDKETTKDASSSNASRNPTTTEQDMVMIQKFFQNATYDNFVSQDETADDIIKKINFDGSYLEPQQ